MRLMMMGIVILDKMSFTIPVHFWRLHLNQIPPHGCYADGKWNGEWHEWVLQAWREWSASEWQRRDKNPPAWPGEPFRILIHHCLVCMPQSYLTCLHLQLRGKWHACTVLTGRDVGQVRVGATNDDSSSEGAGPTRGPKRHCGLKTAVCDRLCGRRAQVNILDNATGQAKMGELVGVLGPSGAFQA